MMRVIFKMAIIACVSLTMCQKSDPIVIKDERFYMEEIKFYAAKCRYDPDCMTRKIKKNIPPKYYVHVRRIKTGWEFACIDKSVSGSDWEIKKAQSYMDE